MQAEKRSIAQAGLAWVRSVPDDRSHFARREGPAIVQHLADLKSELNSKPYRALFASGSQCILVPSARHAHLGFLRACACRSALHHYCLCPIARLLHALTGALAKLRSQSKTRKVGKKLAC